MKTQRVELDCNFAVSLVGFVNMHTPSADIHFKLTRYFAMLNCNVDKFKEIYNEMYQAMIAKDTVGLGNILDESFVLVHMTGMMQSKQEYLRLIENGTLNYYSCDDTILEKNRESDSEDKMHVVGKSRVNAAVFGGSRRTWPLQLDIDLVEKGNEWKITKIKASTY